MFVLRHGCDTRSPHLHPTVLKSSHGVWKPQIVGRVSVSRDLAHRERRTTKA